MNKLILVLAALAVANAALMTNSPTTGSFSVAPGQVFLNSSSTDTAFMNWTGPIDWTGGFDNTTNYVWIQNSTSDGKGGRTPTFIRRAFNASSPGTVNATKDLKITTTLTNNDSMMTADAPGYLGVGYTYGSNSNGYQNDVNIAYCMVNGSAFTSVKVTSNTAANLNYDISAFWYDTGIFYVIYFAHNGSDSTDKTMNNVYIQGVSVATGAVVYNSTGGVSLMAPTSQVWSTISFGGCMGTNITNTNASTCNLVWTDYSTATAPTIKSMSVNLYTGAPGSAVTLATGDSNTTAGYFMPCGGLGSFYNSAIFVCKMQDIAGVKTNSSMAFFNGSGTASSTFNITVPSGYRLSGVAGYALVDGAFALLETFSPTSGVSGAATLINRENFFSNGTLQAAGSSVGTYWMAPTFFQDATNSIWAGYVSFESYVAGTNTASFIVGGYAGELQFQELSANTLASIFASLALMIAALFAF